MAKAEFLSPNITTLTTLDVFGSGDGKYLSVANYPRTFQFLSVGIQGNTPTLGDLKWQLRAGPQELARGRGIIVGAGAEFTFPDSYTEVRMTVMPNVTVMLDVSNVDTADHTALVSVILDKL